MRTIPLAILLVLTACSGGGGGGVPISTVGVAPDIVFCRADRENTHNASTIRTSTRRGLANEKIPDRAGRETNVRVNADGARIVFVRERRINTPSSREVYVSTADGSAGERRVTADNDDDRSPCWLDDTRILFSSDRESAGRRLWTMNEFGSELEVLWDDGLEQHDPDANEDFVVYSAYDALAESPRRTLWLYDRAGMSARQLTDGGTGTLDSSQLENPEPEDLVPGDFEPALSPDGTSVLFTRTIDPERRQLMRVTIADGAVVPLGDGTGEDRWPRWSPLGDAIFVARSRPAEGLEGLRLFELAADGTDPLLIFPDKRFEYPGFDALPAIGPRDTLEDVETVAVAEAEAETVGSGQAGNLTQLEEADGFVISILTGLFDLRDVAGLKLDVPLPAEEATDIARIDVSARVALNRNDGDTVVRMTLENFENGRNDTIVERTPAGTGLETYSFSVQSHAHIARDRHILLQIIGDLPEGERAELSVDQVTITVRKIVPPPPPAEESSDDEVETEGDGDPSGN